MGAVLLDFSKASHRRAGGLQLAYCARVSDLAVQSVSELSTTAGAGLYNPGL